MTVFGLKWACEKGGKKIDWLVWVDYFTLLKIHRRVVKERGLRKLKVQR